MGQEREVHVSEDPMNDDTRDLMRELARDLSPVERIARLRTAALRILGLWALLTLAATLAKGLTTSLSDPEQMMGGFGAVLAGLSLVGVGGLLAALAATIPGREGAVRAASGVAGFGVLVALGLGSFLMSGDPAAARPATLGSDLACLITACIVALLPAAGALLYVVRAAPARPLGVLMAVGAGCVALGAFTSQLGCTDLALRHLLVSHALAPAIGALLFLTPLWIGFQRLRPR